LEDIIRVALADLYSVQQTPMRDPRVVCLIFRPTAMLDGVCLGIEVA
jgi:hypothetical protein